jgi:hypothetical protein
MSLYADDAALFINPASNKIDTVMAIMDKFGQATGLRINASKSSVTAIRCSDFDLDSILHSFQGVRTSFPMNHLGLPITLGRLCLVHLQRIQDKVRAKLSGWQGKLLTLGGCHELVRSVLSSLPVYLLTALKPPKKFFTELDKARRRFLWAGNQPLHGGKCKVSWSRVCRPLE